jgi:hypothetical protein
VKIKDKQKFIDTYINEDGIEYEIVTEDEFKEM